uniref:Uncharacterized protein n=1 Tax=Pararge aegeria TaxID=116150 RepID=S4PCT7_9NEOP
MVQTVSSLLNKYSKDNSSAFFKHCESILKRSSAQDAPSLEMLELYKFLNFIALTMLRATTKTGAQMVTGFLKKQYKNNITTFAGPIFGEKFSPPCSQAVLKTVSYLNKTNKQVSCVMAKLVLAGVHGEASVKSRLDASVLTHTSWHGLGILQMLFDICEFFGKTWIEVYQLTILTCNAQSWKAIFGFLKTYHKSGSEDPTVPWARVIDDAYLTKYNPQNHPILAAIFRRSIEYAQGEEGGITNAVWAQKHHRIVDKYSSGSEWLLSQLNQEDITVQAGHAGSRGLAAVMNADKRVTISHRVQVNRHEDTTYDDI